MTFGDSSKGKIVRIGKIANESSPIIEYMLVVEHLKYNLLSISRLFYKSSIVTFTRDKYIVLNNHDCNICFITFRYNNAYNIELENIALQDAIYFLVQNEISWLWHRRLGHHKVKLIFKLSKFDLLKDLSKKNFFKDKICYACQQLSTIFTKHPILSMKSLL